MAISTYLAMTAGEIARAELLPEKLGYMSCRFSPSAPGLSNLPRELPPGSLLILDDREPMQEHDPERILAQLEALVEQLRCCALLLDFQRPSRAQEAQTANLLSRELSCPVAVSSLYAQELGGPVFLPPAPLGKPLQTWLEPWQGREIWLELAVNAELLTLTAEGCRRSPVPEGGRGTFCHPGLHLHYDISVMEDRAEFILHRTREDLPGLLEEAEALGVTQAVGLYQELSWMV